MSPSRILQTKLHMPRTRSNIVPRSRLLAKLNAGLDRRLVLVSAPAGYGKTTLVTEWLHSLTPPPSGEGPGVRAIWLSLDEGDNDLPRFLDYLLAAFRQVRPEMGQTVEAMLQSPGLPLVETIATTLLEEWSGFPVPVLLVLDDYHAITNLAIHELLNKTLVHLPPLLHLVIVTRSDPPLPLARLRVRNEMIEIRANDLCFTLEEVDAFLARTMGLTLSQEQVLSLETRTEGWIAGLQLAGLSMQGRENPDTFISTFTGSHHYVVDYLVDEVLGLQPDEIRDFLLKTSILKRMNGSLCNALTGRSDGQSVLEELYRSNLFISALDDDHQWFRYHHLFGDVLQNRLRQELGHTVPACHHQAARWLEANGFLSEAIGHALAAENIGLAADIVERHAADMLMRGEMMLLLQWMDAIDPALHQNASLCITKAWALAFTNRSEVMDDLIREAEMLIAGDQDHRIRGDIAALRAYLAGIRGLPGEAIESGQRALSLLPESNLIVRGVVSLTLGGAYFSERELEQSSMAFEQASRIGQKVGSTHLASTALYGLSNSCQVLGQLHRAREFCEQALEISKGRDGKLLPTAADPCLGLGNLFYEWNDLAAAESYLSEGIRLIRLLGRASSLADCQISMARLQVAQGNLEQAAKLLREAESQQQSSILHPAVHSHLAAAKIELSLRTGEVDAAKRYAAGRGFAINQTVAPGNSTETIQYGYVLLACGDAAQAGALAGNLIEFASPLGWNDLLIRSYILQAQVLGSMGETAGSIQSLEKALRLAAPEGYVRVFLDHGRPLQKLLSLVQPVHDRQRVYLNQLLAFPGGPSHAVSPSLLEPLSERELEVLRLVALGRSNQQIAGELFLATGTVKKHLNNIFGKLAVQNRTECVARARELNLL